MAKKRIKHVSRKVTKSPSRYRLKDLMKGVSKKNRHPRSISARPWAARFCKAFPGR